MLKRFVAVGSAALIASAFVAQAKPLSSEDFSKHPNVSSISMSLEGDMLVGVVADPSKKSETRAAAYWDISGKIDTTKPLVPSAITPSSGKTMFFAASALKDKKSLWFTVQPYIGALYGCGEGRDTGATKKYLQKAYMGNEMITEIDDLPSGRAEVGANKDTLRCFELVGETNIETILPLDPSKIIISRASTKSGTSYFSHDLANGREKFLYKASDTQAIAVSSKDGMPVARTELDYSGGAWRQHISLPDADGKFNREDALSTDISNRYTMNVVGRQNGTGKYFVITDKFSDKASVYLYDAEANTFSDTAVLAHPEFDITNLIFSQREQDFGELLGFAYDGAQTTVYWLDPEMKGIQDGLDAAFPGKHVTLSDYTADRNRVLFQVSATNSPPAYYLLVDKSKVAVIGSERPWISEDSLGKGELVYYTARDGMKIPALITYPAGFKEGDKAKGAILVPHGGPWARDYAGFDSSGWTQYFASRGYIIMQPQYRGSAGWGRELWLAGDGEWGQKMQDDKDDGAAWLVSQGYVDADKIAIHGYSYGGFAAIAASVRPNSPYQCAIAGAGVGNLAKLSNEWGDNRIQRIVQGDTVKGMDPIRNTDKANIPVLLYVGDRDVRTPAFHAKDFYNGVKGKVDAQFHLIPDMPHSMPWYPRHMSQTLRLMEDFLKNKCGTSA